MWIKKFSLACSLIIIKLEYKIVKLLAKKYREIKNKLKVNSKFIIS